MAERKIEVVEMCVSDLKQDFGNPRKISTKKKEELKDSLETHGDFGLILIDEDNNIIAGNQRVTVMKEQDPSTKVLCKRLVGYSKAELRAINIKDNTHNGEWDLDMLADWTADLNIDLGIKLDNDDPDQHPIEEMELLHYEKYDYVLIACRSQLDYNDLVRKLGIEDKKVPIATRKIKARAIWYDKMKATLVPNDVYDAMKKEYTGEDTNDDRTVE